MATTFKNRLEELEPQTRKQEKFFAKVILPLIVNMKKRKPSLPKDK